MKIQHYRELADLLALYGMADMLAALAALAHEHATAFGQYPKSVDTWHSMGDFLDNAGIEAREYGEFLQRNPF